MAIKVVRLSAFIVLAITLSLPFTQPASAITADLAKKCRASAIKAHPTVKAGSKTSGVEKAQRDAYQACITKEGKDDSKSDNKN